MQLTAAHKKAIDHYYKELSAYQEKKVTHETAVRSAFQDLLKVFAQSANWVLIPEQALPNGKRPDGTLRDTFNLPRGYAYCWASWNRFALLSSDCYSYSAANSV